MRFTSDGLPVTKVGGGGRWNAAVLADKPITNLFKAKIVDRVVGVFNAIFRIVYIV